MAKKILLVDDSRLFLEVEKTLFRRTGAEILTATCGTEALRRIAAERPDLVILDMMMPDINGDKVCAQIKSNPETAEIAVIMVTTKGSVEDVDRCRKAGCDDFVTKPLHHQNLLARAAELLRVPHRKSLRIFIRIEAKITAPDREVSFGNSVDLSTTGIFVDTVRVLEVGDIIQLGFLLPNYGEIHAQGRVARVLKREFRRFGYGIEFTDVAHEAREAIARFVQPRRSGT